MKHAVKTVGRAAVLVIALLLLIAAALYLYATSPAGERYVRDRAMKAVNAQLPGEITAATLELVGSRVVLTDVVLRDPEGEVVARIARVEAIVDLLDAAGGHIHVQSARVIEPQAYLRLDERGLNLLRALKAETGKTDPRGRAPSIQIADATIEGGRLELVQHTQSALAEEYRVEDLSGRGALALGGATAALRGSVSLAGRITAPTEGPLSIDVRANQASTEHETDFEASLAGMRVALAARGVDRGRDEVTLSQLTLPPATLRAFVPRWPLAAEASLSGRMVRTGSNVQLDLHGSAADAALAVSGGVDVAALRADDLVVEARDLDFAQLVEDGPQSRVSLRLRASGGGRTLQTLDGRVDLSVPEAALGDQRLGPVEVHATAQDGNLKISSLSARVPGATLEAKGHATLDSMSVSGKIAATDLRRLGSSLGRVVRRGGIPIAGAGALSFRLSGPSRHPAVELDGRFASLRYQDIRAEGLSVRATLPDVRRPLEAGGDVQARQLIVGDRRFRALRAQLTTRGRDLVADVSARGFADVVLHLAGTLERSGQAVALSDVKLRYPESTWTLARPTLLVFAGGQLSTSELTLESGRQRVSIDGGIFGRRLDVAARLDDVALDRLPRALLPDAVDLSGEVDAQLRAGGTTARPEATIELSLRDGRIQRLTGVELEVAGKYIRERATGEILARALETQVKGTFDVPVRGLLMGTRDPISADLTAQQLELEPFLSALGVDAGLSGTAAATLKVQGTASDPAMRLVVTGKDVRHRAGPSGDLNATVESRADGTLQARIDLRSAGAEGDVAVNTAWTAADLLRGKVRGRALLDTPVEVEATVRDMPLAALQAWSAVDTPLQGKGTLSLRAHGPIVAPEGELRVTVDQLAAASTQPVDGEVRIVAGAGSITLAASASRGGDRLLHFDGDLRAPVSALLQRASLQQVPLSLAGDLGPIALADLQAFTSGGQAPPEDARPNGIVRAHVDVRGTAAAPIAAIDGRLEKLGVAQQALGTAEFTYRYAAGVSQLASQLASASGGTLNVQGRATLELSSPALQRGIEWRKAPIDARLSANEFDPAFLSRLTHRVREAGGRVDGDARVGGTLGAPSLEGRIEWREGRLALTGYGQYRRIHLLLEGTQDDIALRDLSAESGAGRVTMTARGARRGDVLELSGGGELTRFPVIADDQLRAIVTTRFTLTGEATAELVTVRELAIPQAQVELPEVRRKDLQNLDRPNDVILVRNGEPLYKRRRSMASGEGGGSTAGGATAGESGYRGRRLVLLVNAPRNIWLRGVDINAEMGLSDQFRVELADRAYLFGEVRFMRGRVDVLGRRFDLLRDSQVRFTGPVQSPFVNVTAEYANEREGVTVFTTVRGQGRDIALLVNSNPPLSESEIYTLLATGRRTLERGSGASLTGGEAASVVGSFAASQVRRVISNTIPLDVLSIEAGAQGLSDASFEAGKYITDKVYVGAVGRLGADPEENENSAAFRLEYRFNNHWSFETEYGDARRGSADVIWSVDY